VRLFFDVEGAKFVADGPVMRETPVLLMLHGGARR
jgi:proline iminopeptidase